MWKRGFELATFGLVVDIILVAVLVVFAVIGYKKGLLRTVLSFFSWVMCVLLAMWLAKYVAGWINGIYDFSAVIGRSISKSLIKSNDFFAQAVNVYEASGKDALISAIPTNNKLLAQLVKVVFSKSNVDMSSTNSIGSVVGANLGQICMVVIAGILIFFVLKIALALLMKLFKKIEQTKVLGGLNKILGLTLGLIKGAFIVLAINCVLVALTLIPFVNKTVDPIIQDHTHVEKFVYKTTDKLFGKYVIEGNMVGKWIEISWNKR